MGKHRGQGRAEQSEVPTEELDEEVSWEKLWFPRPKSSRGHLELTEGFLVRETGTGTPVWGRCKASGLVCYAPIYKVLWFVRLLNVEQQGGRLAVGCLVRHRGFSFSGNKMLIGHFICFYSRILISVSIHCPLWRWH